MPRFNIDDYTKPSFGYYNTAVLQAVAKPDADNEVKAVWAELGWPVASFQVFPSSSSLPSSVGVDMGDTIYVGINGTDSIEQVLKYGSPASIRAFTNVDARREGYYTVDQSVDPSNPKDACNRQFDSWGREVFQRIMQVAGNRKVKLMFAGHSYGGAVVLSAARYCNSIGNFGPIRVVTFGSPKVYGRAINAQLHGVGVTRWMNTGDPIPALPPSEGEVGVPLSLTRKIGLSFLVPQLYQTFGGFEIEYNGKIKGRSSTQITPTIIDWFTQDIPGHRDWLEPTQHYLTQYAAMLHLAAHLLGEFGSDTDTESLGIGGDITDNYYSNRPHLWAAIKQVFLILTEKKVNPMIEPSQSPFVPKPYRAIIQPNGPGWVVNWMGRDVYYSPAKTKCISYRKVLDHLLRRCLVGQLNYTTNFEQSLTDFSTAAAAGSLGFRPDVSPWLP